MDEQRPQEENEQSGTRRIVIIAVVVILAVLLLGFALYFFMTRNENAGIQTGTGPAFGTSEETGRARENGEGHLPPLEEQSAANTDKEGVQLFRQLSQIPVAGFTTVTRGGTTLVRYVSREKGHVYEVNPQNGDTVELTNTTIPRVYEAYFAMSGNTVILRYLTEDPATRRDVVKTYLANLILPVSTTTNTTGSLRGNFLPDNVSAVSVSPNGNSLFYLLPTETGVAGTIVTIATKSSKEVFHSPFREWSTQLLNNSTVILTTKPSAKVAGFSYIFNPKTQGFTRLVREKNGLTTLSNTRGDRMLFSENISGNTILGTYDKKGFPGDEGVIEHENPIPISTLPEKCAWANNAAFAFCGAFTLAHSAQIPDQWYQGVIAISDTFWKVNTNTNEITLLADPKDAVGKPFDVTLPLMTPDDKYMLFADKNDGTLWGMHVLTPEESEAEAAQLPKLTPEEMRDYLGSTDSGATTPKKTPVKK